MVVDDSTSFLDQEPTLGYLVDEIFAATKKLFVVEKGYFEGEMELMDDLRSFDNKFLYYIATRGRVGARFFQASNSII